MLSDIESVEDLRKIPKNKLHLLADEIRERIIGVMSSNGGHLASNLGVVELTIALHYVFSSPEDRIIFDVGHQSYTHKILTGRNKNFETVRMLGGLSGFTRRSESEHDFVDSGHSSTSISQGIGFTVADKLSGKKTRTISVIGDGALTGGVALEGLNFSGHLGLPLVVVLNDNEMSIGNNVGAISKYINKFAVSKFYQEITDDFEESLKKSKWLIKWILSFMNAIKRGIKLLFGYENLFTSLGFDYIGAIDGHNLKELIYIFERVKKNVKHPVLLHIKTIKGKGFLKAEGNPSKYHGVTPNIMNEIEPFDTGLTYTDVFSRVIVDEARKNPNVVAITAAMESGVGLTGFRKEFPDRFFDVGIAEQNAVSFAAALGYSGYKPVFAVYSTFLTRAMDQVCQDICISKSPVLIAVDRAGITGADGETHQGMFDLSLLRIMPNIFVYTPCDATDMELVLRYAMSRSDPAAVRYPRERAEVRLLDYYGEVGTDPCVEVRVGNGTVVVTAGTILNRVMRAAENLGCGIIYLRQVKPIDNKIYDLIDKYERVVFVEESVFNGSAGAEIAAGLTGKKIHFINLPDKFIPHGKRDELLDLYGFAVDAIRAAL